MTFSFSHDGATVAFSLHLAVHGLGYIGWRIDALDLHPNNPGTPHIGGLVEDLPELGIDRFAGGQRLIEIHVSNDVPEVRLGELGCGDDEVRDVVAELHGICCLVVDDGINRYDNVVLRDDLLGLHINNLLTQIDLADLLDERHDQVEARVERLTVSAETFDEPLLILLDDLDSKRDVDDEHTNQ